MSRKGSRQTPHLRRRGRKVYKAGRGKVRRGEYTPMARTLSRIEYPYLGLEPAALTHRQFEIERKLGHPGVGKKAAIVEAGLRGELDVLKKIEDERAKEYKRFVKHAYGRQVE